MNVTERINAIAALLREKPTIPFEVIETIDDMIGFDGCSCQIEQWWYSPSTDSYFSKKYGCGTGASWWDRAILHIVRPKNEGGDLGFLYRSLKKEYANGKFLFDEKTTITIPDDLVKI